MKKMHKCSSDTLLEIANHKNKNKELTYKHVLQMLGERAFGVIILFFALPSALPFSAIPGVSALFSIPILLCATQIILDKKRLWMPKIIADRTIPHENIAKVIHKTAPYIIKIEYLLKPRWSFMTKRLMETITGLFIFCLALFLMLPIPFSNLIFATLLIIFSLGLIEKDGVFLIIGYVGSLLTISFFYLLIIAAVKHLFHL